MRDKEKVEKMVDKPKWGCWLYEPKVFFFPTPSRLTPENKSAPNGLPCNLAAVNNGESNKRSRRWSKKVDQLFQEKQSTTNQATLTGLRKNSSSFICGWSERKKKEPHVLITIFRFPSSLGLNGRERIGKKEKPTSHAKASLKVTHSNFFSMFIRSGVVSQEEPWTNFRPATKNTHPRRWNI